MEFYKFTPKNDTPFTLEKGKSPIASEAEINEFIKQIYLNEKYREQYPDKVKNELYNEDGSFKLPLQSGLPTTLGEIKDRSPEWCLNVEPCDTFFTEFCCFKETSVPATASADLATQPETIASVPEIAVTVPEIAPASTPEIVVAPEIAVTVPDIAPASTSEIVVLAPEAPEAAEAAMSVPEAPIPEPEAMPKPSQTFFQKWRREIIIVLFAIVVFIFAIVLLSREPTSSRPSYSSASRPSLSYSSVSSRLPSYSNISSRPPSRPSSSYSSYSSVSRPSLSYSSVSRL
jgi:hypothetical protein